MRLGIELADRLDLVAEEVDADGALLLGRVDIEDAPAQRDLAGHLDDVDFRVADREQVVDEHIRHVLFAGAESEREAVIEVTREESHTGRFDGRDDEARRGGGLRCGLLAQLPERSGAVLLDLGVGREVLEGKYVVPRKAQHRLGRKRPGQFAGSGDG